MCLEVWSLIDTTQHTPPIYVWIFSNLHHKTQLATHNNHLPPISVCTYSMLAIHVTVACVSCDVDVTNQPWITHVTSIPMIQLTTHIHIHHSHKSD